MLGEMLLYARQLAAGAASVWFVSWAYRRRYELDDDLTPGEKVIRWILVATGFGLTFLKGDGLKVVRIVGGVVALGFLAWPNFARSLVELAAKLHTAKDQTRPSRGRPNKRDRE